LLTLQKNKEQIMWKNAFSVTLTQASCTKTCQITSFATHIALKH
jgi:hypothetical protein